MDESVLPGAPPCTRSASNQLGEHSREVALIGEPTGGRDFCERRRRGYQALFRILAALLHKPGVRPVVCLKAREKWATDRPHSPARRAKVSLLPRLSFRTCAVRRACQ